MQYEFVGTIRHTKAISRPISRSIKQQCSNDGQAPAEESEYNASTVNGSLAVIELVQGSNKLALAELK